MAGAPAGRRHTIGHTFSRIFLHVVFSTKCRRNSLYKDMRGDLMAYLHGIARNRGVRIVKANAVDDHVHLLLETKTKHSPSDVVRTLKANSSRWLYETYDTLHDFAWQSGYAVFSASQSAVGDLIVYIERQEEHHRRMSFEEELRLLLARHGVEHDPEHYLD